MRKSARQDESAPKSQFDTMDYAAPERFSKNSTDKNPIFANDIFSLGITIYELISGDLPFQEGMWTGMLIWNGNEVPDLPETFYDKTPVPQALNFLFKKCLQKEAWQRPKAEELYKVAESFLQTGTWALPANSKTENSDRKATMRMPSENEVNVVVQDREKEKNSKQETVSNEDVKKTQNGLENSSVLKKRRIFIFSGLFLLVVAGLFFYNMKKNEKYRLLYSKSITYYQVAKYDSALIYITQAENVLSNDSVKSKKKMIEALIPAMKFFYDAKYKEAYQKFLIAADLGSGDANYYLGELTFNGLGTTKDVKKAFAFTDKAINQGFKMGLWRKASCYEKGAGVKADKKMADQLYLESIEPIKKLADAGDPEALGNLGYMYSSGIGVNVNSELALEYYLKSANKGYSFIQYNLAVMYKNGSGVTQNTDEAVKWFLKSAEAGNPSSQLALGKMYLTGDGVEKSISKGLELINKAADQNYSSALTSLAYIYYSGDYVVKDLKKTYTFTKLAVEYDNDNIRSVEDLAYIYESGTGTDVDLSEAVKYYKKAIDLDQSRAKTDYWKIALLYKNGGTGLKKNISEFINFASMASDAGSDDAANRLGLYYFQDASNYKQARRWFSVASKMGSSTAKTNLEYMNTHHY